MADGSKEFISHDELTDLEVVEKVKQGDRKMFSLLVRRHQKSLLRISLRFVKDLETAEDVVQEAFIKAFERLHSFEARSSFKSWIFQIAINTAKNKLRDRKDESVDIDTVPLAVGAMAEHGLIGQSITLLLQKYVEQLPVKQKTALVLRVYEDLSFKEIAEIMECPYDTAKANYRHGLMRLKEELQNHSELQQWTQDLGGVFSEMERRTAEVES
jgi:RNA polymerase sigma-70 factor (ECF subfamily)